MIVLLGFARGTNLGAGRLFQYGDLAGAVHHRQFVGESFLLSDRDHSILFFLCFVVTLIVASHCTSLLRPGRWDKHLLFGFAS